MISASVLLPQPSNGSLAPTGSASRVGWVDYAKGICMIGVVTLYVVNKLNSTGGSGWLQLWADFAQPFRMPDFFLLSGLFLHRVVDRPWRDYLDKKVLHYLYFFTLWSLIFYATRLMALKAGLGSRDDDVRSLWMMFIKPFGMLWFIQLLPVLFIVTRLLRRVPVWIILPLATLLQMFPPAKAHSVLLAHFCERFIYFYVGYHFASRFFDLAAWAQSRRLRALGVITAWALLNGALVFKGLSHQRGVALSLGILGAMGVITAASLLMNAKGTDWLRYLGQHSLVIYLGFFIPMQFSLALARRAGALLDPGTFGLAASALSVFCSLALFWITRNTWMAFLFSRPTWIRVPRP